MDAHFDAAFGRPPFGPDPSQLGPEDTPFRHFFTLEEAAELVDFARQALIEAHKELRSLQDEIILYKRMHSLREGDGELDESEGSTVIREVLKEKWNRFDEAYHRWEAVFDEKGIIVRSMQRGLIDFPYKTQEGEVLFLCWQYGEDGILYFHPPDEGFGGRRPITLLPD